MKFALPFGNLRCPILKVAAGWYTGGAAVFDSVFAVDHVVFPDTTRASIPMRPGCRLPAVPSINFTDPLIWLTWVAAPHAGCAS